MWQNHTINHIIYVGSSKHMIIDVFSTTYSDLALIQQHNKDPWPTASTSVIIWLGPEMGCSLCNRFGVELVWLDMNMMLSPVQGDSVRKGTREKKAPKKIHNERNAPCSVIFGVNISEALHKY